MQIVLLHSPLVGPGTRRRLALALEARGHAVCVPDLRDALAGDGPFYPRLSPRAAAAISDEETLVIAHSGAGALIPAALERAGKTARAVFVDALLPHPGRSSWDGAPDTLRKRLDSLTHDGRVAPWRAWWPRGALESVLGDEALYREFAAELTSLPRAYFTEAAPAIGALDPRRCAYLQLSEGYAAERDEAEALGWLT